MSDIVICELGWKKISYTTSIPPSQNQAGNKRGSLIIKRLQMRRELLIMEDELRQEYSSKGLSQSFYSIDCMEGMNYEA